MDGRTDGGAFLGVKWAKSLALTKSTGHYRLSPHLPPPPPPPPPPLTAGCANRCINNFNGNQSLPHTFALVETLP